MRHDAVEPDDIRQEGSRGLPWKLIVLVVVVVLLAVFFVQNGQRTPVEFLWLDGEWPVWTVIGVSVVIGVVIDRLGTWQWRRSRRRPDGG